MPKPQTIEHTNFLEELTGLPKFLQAEAESVEGRYSCSFCGVGDSVWIQSESEQSDSLPTSGVGMLTVELPSGTSTWPMSRDGEFIEVQLDGQPRLAGPLVSGLLKIGDTARQIVFQPLDSDVDAGNGVQRLRLTLPQMQVRRRRITAGRPTAGCLKMKTSMGLQRPVFPIHVEPSVLDPNTAQRVAISYDDAIRRFADLLLAHRPPHGRTLIYACGQIDYFTVFAFQEVFRLLGVKNLAGNAEHCLNAGAVHNEILTGQEGPFLTIEQALAGPNRFYLLNGWNGLISHPPAFNELLKRPGLDAYLVEVVETESARAFVKRAGPDRLLLVRSGSDPQLALSVAHEVLATHSHAVSERFLSRFADRASFEQYRDTALRPEFAADATAARIAPVPELAERLERGIRDIAAKLARPEVVPINIPSVGLSQTKGAVAHCLWGSLLGMLGKYGLMADGTPAGGTLRIPGQINAQSEVQGLSHKFFMGRVRMTEEGIREATQRMGLPADAYQVALGDAARPALDYGQPTVEPELFVCFGTQFESNMLGRKPWIEKLTAAGTTLVVVDPIPDPFSERVASLLLPSPPHSAAAKLYQNGEWRLSLSSPQRRQAEATRTDATIVYDVMAEISRRLRGDAALREKFSDLGRLSDSGYLQRRFEPPEAGGELVRIDGEVSRKLLWERVQHYMAGPDSSLGPLYCRPEHADGRPILWNDLVQQGSIIYGGVGTSRYRLDYDDPNCTPFRDIFRRPGKFRFFAPTEADLRLPDGIVMNSGRSTLSDDKKRIHFAIATFNSGKATTSVDLPDENPLYVSRELAARLELSAGDLVRVTGIESGGQLVLPVIPTDRVRGEAVYINFHKTKAEIEQGRYLNDVTSHLGRCPYTAQSDFKLTRVTLERVS